MKPTQLSQLPTSVTAVLMVLVSSLHFVFGRMLHPHMPPASSGFYVLVTATVIWGGWMVAQRKIRWQIARDHALFFLSIGFLIAISTVLNYIAVGFIDAGTATLLSRITTVFGLGFGYFWLRERLSQLEWLGAIVCVGGSVVISFQPGDILRFGSLLVIVSTFTYSLHAAVTKRYGSDIEFGNFFLFRLISTSLFLLGYAVGSNTLTLPPSASVWGLVIVIAVIDVVLSRFLYYAALRMFSISMHSLILTAQPVVAILWSILLFREAPTPLGWTGGVIILTGLLVVGWARQRNAATA